MNFSPKNEAVQLLRPRSIISMNTVQLLTFTLHPIRRLGVAGDMNLIQYKQTDLQLDFVNQSILTVNLQLGVPIAQAPTSVCALKRPNLHSTSVD